MAKRNHRSRGGPGRPCKVNDINVMIPLVIALDRRWTIANAAKAAKIDRVTVWRWITAGQAGDPRFKALAAVLDPPIDPVEELLRNLQHPSPACSSALRRDVLRKLASLTHPVLEE
jgi:hypothetical protein